MSDTNLSSTTVSDFKSEFTDFSVAPQTTDGATDQKETRWTDSEWTQKLGYYKSIPELKSAIDTKVRWVIGKGYKSNEITELALMQLKGFGKDSFNSILKNQYRVSEIGGDSYAEIIRAPLWKRALAKLPFVGVEGQLINLKPLSPEFMVTVANRSGMILRYEQTSRMKEKKNKTFKPEEIFHLSKDRVADEIHGTGVIDVCKENILMRNEAMEDYKKLLHRNIYPSRVHHLDTDDTSKIASYKQEVANAKADGEDIFVPKGNVEMEIISVAPTATLNPLPWINLLTQKFYQEVGTPQIVVGGAQEIIEASGKISYLAWEQTVEDGQLYVEEQVLSQLNLEIDLEFPASLQNELLSDNRKAETMQASTPEDTAVTGEQMEGGGV